ncbi:MAG: ribonuclease HI family protein [Actinomycetota bacterium]|jgi:ribonuclease HI|nr:ribonuclease HI family protein [Actinomycetota bacterium]
MSDSVAILHSDGGARGNPGPAGAGFILTRPDGTAICRGGRYLGETTNNIAEYEALIWGLETAKARGVRTLSVFLDSELIVKQIAGTYRVKHPNLKPRYQRVVALMRGIDEVTVGHVRRENNKDADALANEAMDSRSTVGDADAPAPASDQTSLF